MNLKTLRNLTEILDFNHKLFGHIRAFVNEQRVVKFIAKDVLVALGYKNVSKALADHVDGDDVTKRYPIRDSKGRPQLVNAINESGLYALILGSKLPNAKVFKHWVTSEVLPQIARTGGYIPLKNIRTCEELTKDQVVEKAFGILQKTISRENLPADGCFTTTEIAKEYGLDVKELSSFLVDKGIVKRSYGHYYMMPKYESQGYDAVRIYHSFSLNGRAKAKPYLVWTPKGKELIDQMVRGELVA